jgi:glycosyltransferase involved in cell wall biosynthesis
MNQADSRHEKRSGAGRVSRPRIVILNQVVGPVFRQLVEDMASRLGPAWLLTGSLAEIQRINQPGLEVIPATNYRRDSTTSRLSSWLSYMVQAARLVGRSPADSLLFLVSNPPFLPLFGWVVSKLRGQPYAVLVYDIYPNILISAGRTGHNSLLSRAWRAMNRLVWQRAAAVFTIGPHMARNVEQMFDPKRTQLGHTEIVPNWAETNAIRPLPKSDNQFARQHGQVDKLTVLYCGNVGNSHDIESLVAAADQLRDEPGIAFMIVGRGARFGYVRRQVRERSLSNVTLLGWQHESKLQQVLSVGDVAVISLAAGFEGLSVPSRTYYAMSAGSAILAVSRGPDELQDLIDEHECGLHVQPGNPQELAAALARFRNDPTLLQQCRANSRRAAEKHFDRSVCSDLYVRALRPFVPTR